MPNHTIHFNRTSSKFDGITEDVAKQLQVQYPGVDLTTEFKRMTLWLLSKGKSHKGTLSFITNWLGKARPTQTVEAVESEVPHLTEAFKNYLEDLWTYRENLLNFNTRRKAASFPSRT